MPPVVVVGAGPTGILAALLLAQQGVEVLVLERWPDVYPQPRAVHLDDEVLRVLAGLGLAAEFATISRPAEGLQLVDARHRVLTRIDRSGPSPATGLPRANMFDQPELEALLRRRLKEEPLVTLRGGVVVSGVEQDASGATVTFADRVSGAEESARASWVLGCDGAKSVVRASIGSTYEDLGFEQRWLVVDVETTADLGQWEGVHQVCDPARAATYMRVGTTRYRWEFRLLEGETASQYGDLAALRPLIDPWAGHVPDEELEVIRVADYTFRALLADHWRDRRVFLLGDAAHLTPPFIGQGMGAGVRDAANLGWKLAGVVDGSLPASVLDSYAEERRPHARELIGLARLMGVLMTSGGRAGAVLRRVLAPRLPLLPGVRERLVSSESPALRSAAWAPRSRGSLVGRMVPDLAVPGGSYDAVVGARWALVTLQAPAPSDVAFVAARGCALVVVRPEDELGRWLSVAGVRAALVRPDRTVAAAGDSVSDVCGTLAALGVRECSASVQG